MQQSKIGYPYSYGDELTPETARSNRNKMLTILLLIYLLKVSEVQAAPLPGADGFTPTYICRKRQTYSREATGLSIRLEQNPNNQNRPQRTNTSQYIPEFDSTIDNKQIQKKYKHALDFGISGNYNQENAQLLEDKIIEHMKEPSTQIIEGTFKKIEVTHYFNPETGLNVFFNRDNNKFISGWLLKDDQLDNMGNRGERAIIVHNLTDGQVLIFRADTKQLWTPSQLRPNQMRRYLETGAIGKQGPVLEQPHPPKTT